MSDTFVCIRIYPNGSSKYTIRDEEGMKNWVWNNSLFRPGNALFVNGKHSKDTGIGYFPEERVKLLEQQIAAIKLPDDAAVNQGQKIIRQGQEIRYYGDDLDFVDFDME